MTAPITPREAYDLLLTDPASRPLVNIDSQQYLSGLGRFALGALANENPQFRDALATNPIGSDFTLEFNVNNYEREIFGADWYDRAFVYGNAEFAATGRIELVNGELRFVGSITPLEDNYDFALSDKGIFGPVAQIVEQLIDPNGEGVTLPINFSGAGQPIDINFPEFLALAAAGEIQHGWPSSKVQSCDNVRCCGTPLRPHLGPAN